jgi:hypothetical protein
MKHVPAMVTPGNTVFYVVLPLEAANIKAVTPVTPVTPVKTKVEVKTR